MKIWISQKFYLRKELLERNIKKMRYSKKETQYCKERNEAADQGCECKN